jgi:hypothetical protein
VRAEYSRVVWNKIKCKLPDTQPEIHAGLGCLKGSFKDLGAICLVDCVGCGLGDTDSEALTYE